MFCPSRSGRALMVGASGQALLLLATALPGLALIPDFLEFGACAKVTLKADFDPVKYTGLWFDIESVPNEYQHTKECVTQNYTWTGETMTVATRGLTADARKVRQGAQMTKEQHPAHMTVEATGVPKAPYQIVATDYRSYSCVYSCLEYFGFRAEFAWVFSRTPSLADFKIKFCHDGFRSMGVDPEKLIPIVQGKTCPYSEKLEEVLAESEQYLLTILGPEVPSSSNSPPQQEVVHLVQEEQQINNTTEARVLSEHERQPLDSQVKGEGAAPAAGPASALLLLILPLLLP